MSDPLSAAVVATAGFPAVSRTGTIESVVPLQVAVGGSILDPAVVGILSSYSPAVGDVVALLGQTVQGAESSASTWMVLGRIGPGLQGNVSRATRSQLLNADAIVSSAAYVNFAGIPTITIVKRAASSMLHVRWGTTFFVDNAACGPSFAAGVAANGVTVGDFEIGRIQQTLTAGVRLQFFGEQSIPNIPAGLIVVTGRFARIGAVGNVRELNGAGWSSMTVMEV